MSQLDAGGVRRSIRAVLRLGRRRLRILRKRIAAYILLRAFNTQHQVQANGYLAVAFVSRWLATAAGLFLATIFAISLPKAQLSSLKVSEVHLASAGIIGTALALVLSLSIVPAQKAADVFSSAILRLYARDPLMLRVFALLSCAALLSLLFGTGWTLSVSPRYGLAGQLVLLGLSLDALRAFYTRALSLLDSTTALSLVSRECDRYISHIRKSIERLASVHQITNASGANSAATRYALHTRSSLGAALNDWTEQLEEFAHKAIARRDTQAATAVVQTMAKIGEGYSEARRDSMFLLPDFSGGMPIGVSDISNVLDPIYESVLRICQDSAKQFNEAVVQGCLATLGGMAAHAMTMTHTAGGHRTAPLAFSPVFHIEFCIRAALSGRMENAVLAGITATRQVFAKISADTDAQGAVDKALDILSAIALASYSTQAQVSCYKSVEMMLCAALHEIRVRGYSEGSYFLRSVLEEIAFLVPLEAAMDKAGQRRMQTFPPYSLGFEASIPALLLEVAQRVKPVEGDQSWIDPYHEFNEASKTIVHHYREVAYKVTFNGVLLEKWIVSSILTAAKVHIHLLDNPPPGAEGFLETVDESLRWFLHAPSFFFREQSEFPYHHASRGCGELAILGMGLLQRGRFESAEACGEAIRSIAGHSAKAQSPKSYSSAYGFADCVVNLELLTRAAVALDCPGSADVFRGYASRPEDIGEENWPEYEKAIGTRIRQMDATLSERGGGFQLSSDPIAALREILLGRRGATPAV
jgi:hypothetical protein